MNRAELTCPHAVREYIEAGRGSITIQSEKTGQHVTVKFGQVKDENGDLSPIFCKVGWGDEELSYIGFIPTGRFVLVAGRKGKPDCKTFKALAWLIRQLGRAKLEGCRVWHEGSCGKCGRTLTRPDSIESGFGPVCAGRM